MTINELIEKSHAQSKAAGFWDKERNAGECLMSIVSECGKAYEAHRNGRRADMQNWAAFRPTMVTASQNFEDYIKGTFEDSLASIVIRIADLAGAMGWSSLPVSSIMAEPGTSTGVLILGVVKCIAQAQNELHDNDKPVSAYALGDACSLVLGIARAHGIDLWRHIELRLAYEKHLPPS